MDITNKESILGIRQRARDVDHAARTKRRSLARDARRVDLDDIVKKLQVNYLFMNIDVRIDRYIHKDTHIK